MAYPFRPSFLDTCERRSARPLQVCIASIMEPWELIDIHSILRVEVVRSQDPRYLHTQGWGRPHFDSRKTIAEVLGEDFEM